MDAGVRSTDQKSCAPDFFRVPIPYCVFPNICDAVDSGTWAMERSKSLPSDLMFIIIWLPSPFRSDKIDPKERLAMIKQVRANYDAPTIEKEIQEAWRSNDAYLKTKAARADGKKFYFVDGPPYTTGHIHMGTGLNKTIKDILVRYWRMLGYNVRDQPGFDMHGLPIEVQVEKMVNVPGRVNKDGKPDELGIRSKKEIEDVVGIDNFVNTCMKHAMDLRVSMTEEFKGSG